MKRPAVHGVPIDTVPSTRRPPAAAGSGAKAGTLLARVLLSGALLATAGLPAPAAAQTDERPRRDVPGVMGVVVDIENRQPLADVAVTLHPGVNVADEAVTVLTDERGRFVFDDLADGAWSITVERIGYQTVSDSIAYRTDLGLRIDVELVQDALELDPLLVVAEARSRSLESNGFYDRRRRGLGRFMTRDEIQARNAMEVSDVFRTMAGVRMSSGGRYRGQGVVLLRGGCVADVYVDGVRTVPPFPVDAMLRPGDLDAVEVYHGPELPAQFGTSTCGAVMIWTHVPNPGVRGNPFSWSRILGVLGFITAAFLLTR